MPRRYLQCGPEWYSSSTPLHEERKLVRGARPRVQASRDTVIPRPRAPVLTDTSATQLYTPH